jgi:enoyl-CoA hydratase
MNETKTARLEVSQGLAVLTLDRPPVNAADLGFVRSIHSCLDELEGRRDARAVIVTGAGRCFSAGVDLKAVPGYGAGEQRAMVEGINRAVFRLYSLPVPTIAAVNGHAIAGGLVIVLACDYRLGADSSCEIGLTEARAGIPFPAAAMAVLRAELAPHVARRLFLMSRNVSSKEALAMGVLDEVCPREAIPRRAEELAVDLAGIPADTYARIKRQLRRPVIDELEGIVRERDDPMLEAWLGNETRAASAGLLSERRRE